MYSTRYSDIVESGAWKGFKMNEKYTGVSFDKKQNSFEAFVWDPNAGRNKRLGRRKSALEAAKLYNEKAREINPAAVLNKLAKDVVVQKVTVLSKVVQKRFAHSRALMGTQK